MILPAPKYKPFLLLFTALLLLASGILYSDYLNSDGNRKSTQKQFTRELHQKEVLLKETISGLLAELGTTPGEKIFARNKLKQMSGSYGIIIQAYRDGNPVYWSDNTVRLVPVITDSVLQSPLFSSGNGLYRLLSMRKDELIIVGLILIKNDYVYQNEYLKNEFNQGFNIHEQVELSFEKGKYGIYSEDGKFLFSLVFPDNYTLSTRQSLVLLLPYLLFFVLLLLSAGNFINRSGLNDHKWLSLGMYTGVVILLRCSLFLLPWPEKLFSSGLFSPVMYASGTFFSSLGSLLLNSIAILFITNRVFKTFSGLTINTEGSAVMFNLFRSWLIFAAIFAALHGLMYLFSSLVINSQVPFDPGNIEWFSPYGMIALLSACLLIISFLLFANGLLALYIRFFPDDKSLNLYTAGSLIFIMPIYYFVFAPSGIQLIFIILLVGITIFLRKGIRTNSRYNRLFLIGIILLSFLCTIQLNQLNKEKELQKRKAIAEKLTSGRDYFSEYLFADLRVKLMNDKEIAGFFNQGSLGGESEETRLANYIKQQYFQGYWNKYNFLFTICDPGKILQVKPDDYIVNCYEYFSGIIEKNGQATESPGLYYMNNTSINDNYLAVIDPAQNEGVGGKIYIEFYPKHLPTGLGYPEILSNQEYGINEDLSEYSWANYENGLLVHYYGTFFYETRLQKKYISPNRFHTYSRDGFHHLIFNPDKDNVFIISRKTNSFTLFNTRFSILFLSLLMSGLFLSVVSGKRRSLNVNLKSFKNRLQFSYIVLILISFLLIGSASFMYLLNLNDQKNNKLLREKAHSVLVELEHKISGFDSVESSADYLRDILFKFSLVFFTDIHLYDLRGELIATSRPEIFNQGLMAPLMNSGAYNRMTNFQMTEFLQKEKIGNYSYISAYLPFYNDKNELIAYINLPYFARQDELKYEISNLLVAFVNIYFLLFVMAIMIVFAISKYINKPLEIIRKRMASLSLGNFNEKIQWDRDDEIGTLVKEYNRMIDELAKSAELLAKSERETAWRQMAQQIAHEIKNPLTPMKLSVQFLNKAWQDKHSDFEARLRKFTETMIEQIDSLSFTASEFSNFAKFQQSDSSKVDLRETISKAFDRFRDITTVKFEYVEPQTPYFVQANTERLVRIFHNLINNSIQAIGDNESGIIRISLESSDQWHIVVFSDNGSGIPEEAKEKIFSPYFTTKTGGTGLGLSIVKNILSTYGGTIEFKSEPGTGTTFIMRLPVYGVEKGC